AANGPVRAIAQSGNTLYIGGSFTLIGPPTGPGVPLDTLAGVPAGPFPRVTGVVRAVIPDGARGWYIGGSVTFVRGLPRANLARILSDGSVASWRPEANDTVYALAQVGSNVYVGGAFTGAGGQPRNYIAAIDAASGLATSWNPNASDAVLALGASGGT